MRWSRSVVVLCALACRGNPQPPANQPAAGSSAPIVPASVTVPRDVFWHNDGAIMVDVDGNGVTDLVGRATDALYGKRFSIVALDSATGRLLWRTRIPDPAPTPILALWNGIVVSMQARDQLVGLDVKTGTQRWSIALAVSVDWFCSLGTRLLARTGLWKFVTIDVNAGTASAETEDRDRPRCGAVIHDQERGDPAAVPWGGVDPLAPSLDPIQSWHIPGSESRLRVVALSNETYVERGTSTKTEWKTPLPIPDGFTATEPTRVAIGTDTACVSIRHDGPATSRQLTCLDLATGAQRWAMNVKMLERAYIADDRLYLVAMHRIAAHDARSGALVWEVGCPAGTTIVGCGIPDSSRD